jgi:hypothetical protein
MEAAMSLGGFGSYGGLGEMGVFGATPIVRGPDNASSKIVTPHQEPAHEERIEDESEPS